MAAGRRYRADTARLKSWDYSHPADYFVTICTKDRRPFFGHIADYEMHPSPAGRIVAEEWERTAMIREGIQLDAWIVMPNHIHGILSIVTSSPHPELDPTRRWSPNSLGAIINQFKGVCTRRIRAEYDASFAWQARFYDHIIRSDRSLEYIRRYIDGNPATWHDDRLFIETPLP